MEPESTPVSPLTNQPPQPSSPTPDTPASVAPSAPISTPAETPVAEAPVSPSVPAAAPVMETPVSPSTPPTQPVISPADQATFVAPPSGSHKGTIIMLLVIALLAGGAAAGYYYWMNMASAPVAAIQNTEAATSTESIITNTTDPTLRPALEKVIASFNAALATSSYEAFIQTIDASSASKISKADFEKSKDAFKTSMIIDLAKTDFVDLKTDTNRAGYYFLWPATASSTKKTLGMIAFVQEMTGWKIANMMSKDIDITADVQQSIASDKDFSFSNTNSANASSAGTTTSPGL